ncbi:MAG: GTPase HflX [Candidatus Eisenbacteria bacterium]|nr:GTPase HflX [Candidatus Eisenbacteria bacterium]
MLVGFDRDSRFAPEADSLGELTLLAETAGAEVLGTVGQRHRTPNAATLIGKGKVEEVKAISVEQSADLVIFDEDLSPAQVRNLEKLLGVRVIDRSELILDIFARRAKTREARLQVELAQLQYTLPRLTRMWEHLSRLGGGIGTRGPGETQLEVDRRRVREKIETLKKKLSSVEKERAVQRKGRKDLFKVALVGYTNSGKSTLFNALTKAAVYTEDKLFATLDATTRRVFLNENDFFLVTDTVGFIRKLPHHLVASFRATLEEVTEADLLVNVVDAASHDAPHQVEVVDGILVDLGARGKEVITVLNKIDVLEEESTLLHLRTLTPGSVAISALTGENIGKLKEMISESMKRRSGS